MSRSEVSFGRMLSGWRADRGISQLALALESDVSQRHISFLESGRSAPSRDMILRLSESLNVPLDHRNALLAAAGFSHVYQKGELSSERMAAIQDAIQAFLEGVNPAPAIVVDAAWTMHLANVGAARFFGLILGLEKFGGLFQSGASVNVMKLIFDSEGLRPFIKNWDATACALLQRLQRDAAVKGVNNEVEGLIGELLNYPDVPPDWRHVSWNQNLPPAMIMTFVKNKQEYSFHAAVTTIGTPYDITLDDFRIETFFPADDATRSALQKLSNQL